jgi:DNA polymerase-3 subunit epsilon
MDSFVAIDFETATWGAACAVGIVHFEDGVAIDERYTLINPAISARRWDRGAMRIHGISPMDVLDSPTFVDIWPELIHYAACYPLIAHNANFDMGVLRGELARAGLQTPTVRYGCSMALARNAWPKRRLRDVTDVENINDLPAAPENHKLSTLSEFLEIELDHHNALSDAHAAGRITVEAVSHLGYNTLAAAYERPQLNWGEISPELQVAGASKW